MKVTYRLITPHRIERIHQAISDHAWSAAKRLAESKQYAKAIEELKALVDAYPSAAWIQEARGLLARLESDPEAKAEMEKAKSSALRTAQNKEAARLWSMAMNYKNNDMIEQAEKRFREIIEKFPESDYADKAREQLKSR